MYVVTVLFTLRPEYAAEFLQAVIHNAETSLANEPGCRQFDVCVLDKQPNEIFLYELYDAKDAFDIHLGAEHFLKFSAQTAAWVKTKTVHTFVRVSPRE